MPLPALTDSAKVEPRHFAGTVPALSSDASSSAFTDSDPICVPVVSLWIVDEFLQVSPFDKDDVIVF